MTTIRNWLNEVTRGASMRAIAESVDAYNVTFTRRIDSGDAHTIVDVARAWDANPIPGLIAAGILTDGDLSDHQKAVGIEAYSDLELAEVMVTRIKLRQGGDLATVTEFPDRDDLSERRSKTRTPGVEDMPEDAVADSSEDHPEEDIEFD